MRKHARPEWHPALHTEKPVFLIASFLVPFLIMGTMFALHGVYPFGDRQIMVTDFWQQYYPFLSDFRLKLREGASLLWSWTGTGVNYPAVIAYYLASPLNLLAALAPEAFLREALTLILLVKIGLAGLFFALYLRYAFGRNDLSLPVFSVFYALCAFTMGYYWNLMWFDTFALLPLVILGLEALVREGRYKLYVVALALAVGINYYIGFFVCLMTAILFFVLCIVHRPPLRTVVKRFLLIAGGTVLALGMTAALTLPAYKALGYSYSAVNKFPDTLKWYESFVDILGNLIAFAAPTDKEGLPNLYGGLLCAALFAVFLTARGIKLREKLAYLAVIVFLLVSCNLNVLNYIWHGFHFTNMLPYRFSFLVSFLLVLCAYRAYTLLEEISLLQLGAMAALGGGLLLMAYLGPQDNKAVWGSAGLLAAYLLLFLFYRLRALSPRVFHILLAAVVLGEVAVNSYIGVDTVRTTSRDPYPDRYEQVGELLELREDEAFSRTEFTRWYTINDPSLYGYNGVATFSSTVNVSTTRFLEGIGLPAWDSGNRYSYAETSPFTDALLSIRYLVARDGTWMGGDDSWKQVGQSEEAVLLENQRSLPLGFLARSAAVYYDVDSWNPFRSQNDLFSRMTGLEGELFTIVDMVHVGHQGLNVYRSELGEYDYEEEDGDGEKTLKWNYETPKAGRYFVYAKIDNTTQVKVMQDWEIRESVESKRPYIFPCGGYEAGELFSVVAELPDDTAKGNARVFVAHFDQELFERGYKALSANTMNVTEFSETRVVGTIQARREGLLYTSIPYEKGWRAFVDGEEAEIITLGGSMAMVRLDAGEHHVEFRYFPEGMGAGIAATLLSIAVFVLLALLERRRRRAPE